MKKPALLLLFTLVAFFSMGQNGQLILGHWVYDRLADIEDLSPERAEMANKMFGTYSFDFNENGRYKMVIMGLPDGGKWKLENNDKQLVMTANDGSITNLRVQQLDAEFLIIDMGRGTIVMKRGEGSLGEEAPKPERTIVSVTGDQLAKKWYFKGKAKPDASERQKEISIALSKGSYIEFSSKGKYKLEIFGIKEKGKWALEQNGTSVVTMKDDNKKFWYIHSISSTELVLYRGETEEKWFYSTNP